MTACLNLESASQCKCGFISTYLYPSVFPYFGGTKGKFKVYSSNNGGNSFAAAGSKHLTIRYVVAQAATTSAVFQLCSKTWCFVVNSCFTLSD